MWQIDEKRQWSAKGRARHEQPADAREVAHCNLGVRAPLEPAAGKERFPLGEQASDCIERLKAKGAFDDKMEVPDHSAIEEAQYEIFIWLSGNTSVCRY